MFDEDLLKNMWKMKGFKQLVIALALETLHLPTVTHLQ